MNTENIKLFIQRNYSDSQLAALIEHCETGKLSYYSCCCPVGGSTSDHPLHAAGEYSGSHFWIALAKQYGRDAEQEVYELGGPDDSDDLRRKRLLPILMEEKDRRLMVWLEKDTGQALQAIGFPR